MSDTPKSQNDLAWERLFSKYNILKHISDDGCFIISSEQIREFREPRLMAKFDHMINLPEIFLSNSLAILPITRGSYTIGHFDAYHKFEECNSHIKGASLPQYIQSIDIDSISSETVALNCAVAAGIIADFLDDTDLTATVSGRMGSGAFSFNIANSNGQLPYLIDVNNSQIEIDAAYEGVSSLSLFEAKRDLSEDFLVRQLYYPFRTWSERITKPVRSLFLIYSNGIYRLYEYEFQDKNDYNSLSLIKQQNYSIEDTAISVMDIDRILNSVHVCTEPMIQFPQADNYERIINICELLNDHDLNRNDVTEQYDFDSRQTNYYTDAARYLGLLDKAKDSRIPVYSLSATGREILKMSYKQRQLAYCSCILSHKTFNDTLRKYFSRGYMPSTNEIVEIMKASNLYRVEKDSTFERRASTVKGWINWIIGLINE